MKKMNQEQFTNVLTKASMLILVSLVIFGPLSAWAQTATNTYNIGDLAGKIEDQKSGAKQIVSAVCGLIFIAGIVHVIISFVNHSQNLKTIIMSYLGAFIAFAALWAFL